MVALPNTQPVFAGVGEPVSSNSSQPLTAVYLQGSHPLFYSDANNHWYGNPEISGSSPSPVKFYLPIFQIVWKFPVRFSLVCLIWIWLKQTSHNTRFWRDVFRSIQNFCSKVEQSPAARIGHSDHLLSQFKDWVFESVYSSAQHFLTTLKQKPRFLEI